MFVLIFAAKFCIYFSFDEKHLQDRENIFFWLQNMLLYLFSFPFPVDNPEFWWHLLLQPLLEWHLGVLHWAGDKVTNIDRDLDKELDIDFCERNCNERK